MRRTLAELPEETRAALRFVSFETRERPTAEDLGRGAKPDSRGYFYGWPALLPEEDSAALPDDEPPRGVIVLFTANISPLDELAVARLTLHELGHALGYDHDVLEEELGLC
jgi:hypothetical protein